MQSKRCGETILLSHSQTTPPLSLMFCDQTNAHGLETSADWKVDAGAVPLHTIVTDCSHIGYDFDSCLWPTSSSVLDRLLHEQCCVVKRQWNDILHLPPPSPTASSTSARRKPETRGGSRAPRSSSRTPQDPSASHKYTRPTGEFNGNFLRDEPCRDRSRACMCVSLICT